MSWKGGAMLVIKNLVKRFGSSYALDGLTMEIQKGQLYGFVGPNGAGKTTTMKIVASLLPADSGEVIVDGIDALRYPRYAKERIGYMPDFFGVYDNLDTLEYLKFYASIYGIIGVVAEKRIDELLELVDLKEKKYENVDDLSRGMKQRLCLARTLLHQPKLLLLDEPASGLEPRARLELQEILKNLCAQKVTILLSSHILKDLSEMCSHLAIIESGKLVIDGSMKEIMAKQKAENPLTMKIIEGHENAIRILKEIPEVSNIASKEGSISFHFYGEEKKEAELLGRLIAGGVMIASYKREEGNLEEIFLKLTK